MNIFRRIGIYGLLCLALLFLSSCSPKIEDVIVQSNQINIYTLDRNVITNELNRIIPSDNATPLDSNGETKIHVLIDNRETMGHYLPKGNGDTLYQVALNALGGERISFMDVLDGFFLSEVLDADGEIDQCSRKGAIFRNAQDINNYSTIVSSNRDYSLANGINSLISSATPIGTNDLFVVTSNLTEMTDVNALVNIFSSHFVQRRDMNVGIIGLKAEYWGDITDVHRMSNYRNTQSGIMPEKYLDQEVSRFGVQVINRPVYIIIMGGATLVEEYMESVVNTILSHEFYRDSSQLVETVLLDRYPTSESIGPSDINITISINDEFAQYTNDDNSDAKNIDAIFSQRQETVGNRNNIVSNVQDGRISFWRVWDGIANSVYRHITVNIKIPNGLSMQPLTSKDINLSYFSVIEDESLNSTVQIGKYVYAHKAKTCLVDNANNEYINIVDIQPNDGGYSVLLNLHEDLDKDKPILFLVQVQLTQNLPRLAIIREDIPSWVSDWDMNVDEYKNYCHPNQSADGFIHITVWNPNNDFYEGADKTLFLNSFISRLITERQNWIERAMRTDISKINVTTQFGFVTRSSYTEDLHKAGLSIVGTQDDDGQYAFPYTKFNK